VADTRRDALERARRLGATRVVDVGAESVRSVVGELTGGRGADISIEVTGAQGALSTLGEVTRMSGKIVVAGYHQGAPRSIPLGQWNWMAFDLVNAHFREQRTILRGMAVATRLMAAERLSLSRLVTHRFPLDRIDESFRTAHEKPDGFVKAMVTCAG
jgi:threonine dehydrogenase-like Zn-dependent dehydrogenase